MTLVAAASMVRLMGKLFRKSFIPPSPFCSHIDKFIDRDIVPFIREYYLKLWNWGVAMPLSSAVAPTRPEILTSTSCFPSHYPNSDSISQPSVALSNQRARLLIPLFEGYSSPFFLVCSPSSRYP